MLFGNTDTVLFLDDEPIQSTARLTRVYEQTRKFGEVLVPDRPWEGHCVIVFGSVIEKPEGGGYQMWYQTFKRRAGKSPETYYCYAESEDGVSWEKPPLGICEYKGSKDNNIFADFTAHKAEALSVIYDADEADETKRYKLLHYTNGSGGGNGLYAAFSTDGIHWDWRPEMVLGPTGDRTCMFHAPGEEYPYIVYGRHPEMMHAWRARSVYLSRSRDFINWTPYELILSPDLEDSWDVQFYGMPGFKYREYYMGGLQRLWSNADVLDVELVTSRDCKTWTRSRDTFLALGSEGQWDSDWVGLASSPPIEADGSLLFYYEGRNLSHQKLNPFPRGAVGLAALPKDRFCAIEAGPVEGFLTTKPFTWAAGELRVNVNAQSSAGVTDHFVLGGFARIEVLDESGEPIPGFTHDECEPCHGNNPSWKPPWSGGKDLKDLRGKAISLRIYLCNARLYALHAGTGE